MSSVREKVIEKLNEIDKILREHSDLYCKIYVETSSRKGDPDFIIDFDGGYWINTSAECERPVVFKNEVRSKALGMLHMHKNFNDVFKDYREHINLLTKDEKVRFINEEIIPFIRENESAIYEEGVAESWSYNDNALADLMEDVEDLPGLDSYNWVPSSWEYC